MTSRNIERCDASIFDRTLCDHEAGAVMHTFECELPAGHSGAHQGADGECRSTWTDGETWFQDAWFEEERSV